MVRISIIKYAMMKYNIYINCLICFLICFVFSCQEGKEKISLVKINKINHYGVLFNPVRQVVGLEKLDDNWGAYFYPTNKIIDNKKIDWSFNIHCYPQDLKKPCYFGKKTIIEFGIIVCEIDLYASTNYFITYSDSKGNQSRMPEVLGYAYHFFSRIDNSTSWTYYLVKSPKEKKRGNISKSEADSILNSWGLSRPTY